MISRRHLRIKAMQYLYGYFMSENDNPIRGEKELLTSVAKVEDLFLYQVLLLVEINQYAWRLSEDASSKFFPDESEVEPIERFIDNRVVKQLAENAEFSSLVKERGVNWSAQPDIARKIFNDFRMTPEFKKIKDQPDTYAADKDFMLRFIKKNIFENENLQAFYEEINLYWSEDIDLANIMLMHLLKAMNINFNEISSFTALYHEPAEDEKEDLEMIRNIYRKTILNNKEYESIISAKTQNWEVDRIAQIDILIMKMALCEILEMPSIPVKVTLNEYIDISKMYSTPKSSIFINGVLDKMIEDLRKSNKIKKTGRGLI